ncbi:NAC domain-containing protein 71-like isoform X1 [Trifolium pratense]|uniref:NAC domain-containing protein 71-like isoform X1 n=2 Tax=Trifolium pratense TaxID=57577 RepID=UPI001E692911|nr:NAC domain-containing protein 71-like isoform X1 [Trifolium pratense]
MGGTSLPPGFRFHPTDEELIGYYLKRKVEGLEIELEVIPVIDFYKFDPWELPEKSFLPKRDMEWFFFCPRDRKYPNGSRTNRATKAGYWKATGKDRKVVCEPSPFISTETVTGYRKTLVFYCGRAPLGDRTNWIMHEYRLNDDPSQGSEGVFALCRVIKKNEKENDSRGQGGKRVRANDGNNSISTEGNEVSCQASQLCSGNESHFSSPIDFPCNLPNMAGFDQVSSDTNPSTFWLSPDMILDSSKDYSQIQVQDVEGCFQQQHDLSSTMTPWQSFEHTEISPCSSYSNFNAEIEFSDALSRIGCVSPYVGQGSFMDLPYECYDQIHSFTNPNQF